MTAVRVLVLVLLAPVLAIGQTADLQEPIALVVHGGAGTIRKADLSEEDEAAYRAKLEEALTTGHRILMRGGSSLNAVESTLRVLEDSPLFNAGKGAVFTANGRNEMDASIMDGASRRAGAVAGVTVVKNPISAARAVMEKTPHVLLAGPGADEFARQSGLETVPPEYFHTDLRWRQLQKRRQEEMEKGGGEAKRSADLNTSPAATYLGTVGAVALDRQGRLAAGTSTGGMTFKKHGRVGDSPIIGAGTWADLSCGVSATGHGEFFIRYAVAHDICARARYLGLSVQEAAEAVVLKDLVEAGGSGGVIAMDAEGIPSMVFNSEGMYRGWIGTDGEPHVAIYRE